MRIYIIVGLFLVNAVFAASPLSIVIAAPVMAIVCYGLIRINSNYVQTGDVFWFTVFIFFCLSPMQRMAVDGTIGGIDGVTRVAYSTDQYIVAVLIVIVFLVPFLFVKMESQQNDERTRTVSPSLLMLINAASFGAYIISQGGLEGALSPRLARDGAEVFIGSAAFLAFQLVSAVILVGHFYRNPRRALAVLFAILAIALVAVSRNPFNASRFSLLAAWVPIGLALLGGRLNASVFYAISLFGLMVVMPILSITTRFGVDSLDKLRELNFSENFLSIPFIDVFDTLVHSIQFMTRIDWMLGQKTLAIILFFVPRSVWPEKPIVGGLDIGNELYNASMAGTPNLSFFIGGDFYMDFGIIGVGLGAIFISFIFSRAIRSNIGSFYGLDVFSFVLISSLPILLRGPVGAILLLFTMEFIAIFVLGRIGQQSVYAADGENGRATPKKKGTTPYSPGMKPV